MHNTAGSPGVLVVFEDVHVGLFNLVLLWSLFDKNLDFALEVKLLEIAELLRVVNSGDLALFELPLQLLLLLLEEDVRVGRNPLFDQPKVVDQQRKSPKKGKAGNERRYKKKSPVHLSLVLLRLVNQVHPCLKRLLLPTVIKGSQARRNVQPAAQNERSQKQNKRLIGLVPHAVVQPHAVVVEEPNALIAGLAVLRRR